MHILLTRPEQDAARTGKILVERGHTVTSIPLFEIEVLRPNSNVLSDATALAATSANGIRALDTVLQTAGWPREKIDEVHTLPLFVVGDHTAATAAGAGFSNIKHVALDGGALVTFLTAQNLHRDKLVHVCGVDLSIDLETVLTSAGVPCRKLIAYRQSPRPNADREMVAALTNTDTRVDGTLFLSAKTAQRFAQIAQDRHLNNALKQVTAWCLSTTVAEHLRDTGFAKVHVAPTPTLDSLTDLIPPPQCDE